MSSKHVLVLGGSWSGIPAALRILETSPSTKVTMVSLSTSTYWNLAAPRAMLPDQIPSESLFIPINDAFTAHASSGRFTLLQGKATSLDAAAKTVTISGEKSQTLSYDILVIATGSSPSNDHAIPIKQTGDKAAALAALKETQAKIASASHIVVGGGGATSVETAGELGSAYASTKKKTVVLVSGTSGLLPAVREDLGRDAKKELEKLNVVVKSGVRVEKVESVAGGKTKLTLTTPEGAGGEKEVLETDLFLPLFGVHANSEFVPQGSKAENGDVRVDEYLRVKGLEDVYAVGDVNDCQVKEIKYSAPQAFAAAKNVVAQIEGKEVTAYVPDNKPMVGVTVGKNRGIGLLGNFRALSIMIWFFKGRHMMLPNARASMVGKA